MRESLVLAAMALFLPMSWVFPMAVAFLAYKFWFSKPQGLNPFEDDDRKKRKPYELDQRKRDQVLKQGFSPSKVPDNLDAVVVGSGIGGLCTAAILSKAGKKVLVLEQHDQAGGSCHTFVDHGYEFDVGVHYVGKMSEGCGDRVLFDQITDGQLEWTALDPQYDEVSVGYGDERRAFPVVKGVEEWKHALKVKFPGEEAAVDEFFSLLLEIGKFDLVLGALKMLPLWASRFATKSGLIHFFSKLWRGKFRKSTREIVESLTDNKDLQTVFCYCWGNYGTPPDKSHFIMQAAVNAHFLKEGAFYPVGGASEIAYNIIPVVERSGGRVLVRADVEEILVEGGSAVGVRVKKGTESHVVRAPVVVSNAGVYNTFQKLLPREIASKSYFSGIADSLEPGLAAMSVFVGLNRSGEELGLISRNTWAFTDNEAALSVDRFSSLSAQEAMNAKIPLLFVSFPSTKDPHWDLHPGRKDKSTCAIITLASWDWFRRFAGTKLKKRGDEYDELKGAIGDAMMEQAFQLFPQIRNHVDFVDVGSPVTNLHYLAAPHGEIYGLDHDMVRFDPWISAQLRPTTDVPGLFLTGQDVLTCGVTGGLFSGVLTTSAILNRNVVADLETLHARLHPKK